MKLYRYAELLSLDECGLRGVRPLTGTDMCLVVWDPSMRRLLQTALNVAESKIEQFLHIPMKPKFACAETLKWQRTPGLIGPTRWHHVRSLGVEAITDIALAEPITLSDLGGPIDPVTIAVASTVTEPCEVTLWHTAANGGTEIEVDYEDEISISGGVITITLPRCRLVNPTLPVPDGGLEYNDDTNFVSALDIKRRYVDTTDVATLEYDTGQVTPCSADCAMDTQTACGYIRNGKTGDIYVWPGAYSSGAWAQAAFSSCSYPRRVRLNYLANFDDGTCTNGLCSSLPEALEMAIVRLAHGELPYAPCGCEVHNLMWQNDQKYPDLPTADMMNPFGSKQGQLYAWRTMKMFAEGDGGLF